ncbi:MAG: DNA-3-methyladenine glycosylase [Candidatus Kapaibacterium sp.]
MSFTVELERGVRTLVRRDPVIRDLKRQHGLPTFRPHGKYFTTLVRSILSQQISGSAAKTIIGRVSDVVGTLNDPRLLSEVPDDLLRSCGVSSQKLGYLRSLSEHVIEGKLKLRSLSRMSDDEIITALTDVKGIGVWTGKMFLMFSLGRLNVLPYEDLGVRKGAMIAYNLDQMPGKAELESIAHEFRWEPYLSIASWYMWRATE